MSNSDMGYFLNEKVYNIRNRRTNKNEKLNPLRLIKQIVHRRGGKGSYIKFSYRHASQIYEAQDMGFSRDEMKYLLDLPFEAIDYGLSERKTLEPKLIKQLRALYGDNTLSKPYKITLIDKH
jgi:hypothetical protein